MAVDPNFLNGQTFSVLPSPPSPPTRGFELHLYNAAEGRDFVFPWTPQKLGPRRQSTMLPFKILDFGDFQFQRGIGPRQIAISGRLAGTRTRSRYGNSPEGFGAFRDPQWIIQALEDSQEKRTVLQVYVPQIPIFNYKMQIAELAWSIATDGGWAGDLMLDSLQLVEVSDRYLQARPADLTSSWPPVAPADQADVTDTTGDTTDGTSPVEDEATATRSDAVPSTYTVLSGDSLWKIAIQLWGDGSRWVDLYNANKDLIDAQNGGVGPDLIYPGQVFTIPGADGSGDSITPDQVVVDLDWAQPLDAQ